MGRSGTDIMYLISLCQWDFVFVFFVLFFPSYPYNPKWLETLTELYTLISIYISEQKRAFRVESWHFCYLYPTKKEIQRCRQKIHEKKIHEKSK